jgi:hypothetical protein
MTDILLNQARPQERKVFSWLHSVKSGISSKTNKNQFKVFMTVEKEMMLWKLIDGECTEQEERDVKRMISIYDDWRTEYESMLEMHQSFKQLLGKKRDLRVGQKKED